MEKTLIMGKRHTLKFIKNTIFFGFSYDKPKLYLVFFCFIIELDFHKSK